MRVDVATAEGILPKGISARTTFTGLKPLTPHQAVKIRAQALIGAIVTGAAYYFGLRALEALSGRR
jgi:hypothetical protein